MSFFKSSILSWLPIRFIALIGALVAFNTSALGQKNPSTLIEKGYAQFDISNYDSAIVYFNAALSNKNLTVDKRIALKLEISTAHKINSDFTKALIEIKEAEVLAKKHQLFASKALVYITFMEYYRAVSNFDKARFYIKQFEQIPNKLTLPSDVLAKYYNRRSAIEIEGASNGKKSIEFSLKALEYARKGTNEDLIATTYNELGYTYESSEPNKALNYYLAALKIWETLNKHRSIVTALNNIGRFQLAHQQERAAIETFQEAVAICDSFQFELAKKELYINLYGAYMNLKEYKNALDSYLIFHELESKYVEHVSNRTLLELERKYDIQKQINISEAERFKTKKARSEASQKTKQRNILIVFSCSFLLLILVILYLYLRNRKANRLLLLTNEKLAMNLEEKELLYKELHHRVKNNLTLLKGLLYLRGAASSDSNVKLALKECEAQIQSMAEIHARLYTSEDISRIELREYTQRLTEDLQSTSALNQSNFTFEIRSENLETNITSGTLFGLTINELITNSVKHNQHSEGQLHIEIEISQRPDGILLKYMDNGQGLPKHIDLNNGGFGFKLISIMMKQLKSSMTYQRKEGRSVFEFNIPNE